MGYKSLSTFSLPPLSHASPSKREGRREEKSEEFGLHSWVTLEKYFESKSRLLKVQSTNSTLPKHGSQQVQIRPQLNAPQMSKRQLLSFFT